MFLELPLRVMVTGAGGMLGSTLMQLKHTFPGYLFYGFTSSQCDISDISSVRRAIGSVRPDVIINMAALTDIGQCEREPEKAYCINVEGTANLARLCPPHTRLVHISTVAVYAPWAGSLQGYSEEDPAEPPSVYGKSKLEGEKIIQNIVPRHYIVRASWLVGGPNDRKFVGKFLIPKLINNQPVQVVDDKWGSPTYTHDLLRAIMLLLERNAPYGVYNIANQGCVSRYEMALSIARSLHLSEAGIKAVPSSFFDESPTMRQDFCNLNVDKIGQFTSMRTWQEALTHYMERYPVLA